MSAPFHVLISTDRFEGRIVNQWPGVPPITDTAQFKFIKRHQNVILNQYIVVLNDDVITKTATIEVRRAQVTAIAESFAQQLGGKVQNIYETALVGFSIELPNEAAAIEICRSPKVRWVEENAMATIGRQ